MMILVITSKIVLDTTRITPKYHPPRLLCTLGLSRWHGKGLCRAEGSWISTSGYCPAEEIGHFPENFQPGCVSDAAVGKGAGLLVP